MQALTATDPAEITACLATLASTHSGTFFMHESINVNDPADYTRPHFAWANSLFGELMLRLDEHYPDLLGRPL
jgi:meiotically up-regulated gene 157 (Mug157) protein